VGATCSDTTAPRTPTFLQATTPVMQEAVVGTAVPVTPGVVVRDQDNNPMVGVSVSFAVTAGDGSLSPQAVVTGSDGRAAAGNWILGAAAGLNTVTASVAGLSVVFSATGVLPPPVATTVAAVSAMDQQALVGSPVPDPPAVVVRDQRDEAMPGVAVTFAVATGGGSVAPATVITDTEGIARAAAWTLGAAAGSNTVTATVAELVPVIFAATGTIGGGLQPASVSAINPAHQQAIAGAPVGLPPAVLVRDQDGNPLPNVGVAFAVVAGDGDVLPTIVVTDQDGIAAATMWLLGATPGENSVAATVPGLAPVTFTATGLAPASTPTTLQPVAGASQRGLVGAPLPVPPGVLVVDADKNPVPGVGVVFTVVAGGGSVAPAAVAPDAEGIARPSSWTLGPAAGVNSLLAAVGGLSLTFNAIGLAPTSIHGVSAVSQEAGTNSPVGDPPAVLVRDQDDEPLPGVAVAFVVASGGGTVNPASVITDAAGVARLTSWVLGPQPGGNTVTATTGSLPPVTFAATGTGAAAVASAVEALSATTQEAPVGAAVPHRPAVIVRDQNANPIAGVSVAFAVSAGGGAVAPASVTTAANGVAELTSWTLGPNPGANAVTATVSGLTPVVFQASGLAPASVAAITVSSQQAIAGTNVTAPPGVVVRDQNNTPSPGVAVTFTVTAGGGSVLPNVVVTGTNGEAHLTSWTVGQVAGSNTVTATVAGLPAVAFAATGLVPPSADPASIEATTPLTQVAPAGGAVADPPGVVVRNQNNELLAGVSVTFSVTAGGGSVNPSVVVTGATGVAQLTSWTLGASPGGNSLTASVAGLQPVTFSASGILAASSIQATTATDQNAVIGTAVSAPPGVIVRDQHNNPLQGVTVSFAVTAGGGTVSPQTVTTGMNGTAQVASWTVGGTAGPNTLTATVAGLAAVSFNATGYVPQAASMQRMPGMPEPQSAPGNMPVPHPPGVIVLDQHSRPFQGVAVGFAVTAGTGTVSPATVISGSDGIAQVNSWILGNTGAAQQSVTATSSGLPSVVFTATRNAQAPVPTTIEAASPTSQEAPAGTDVSDPPAVIVRDQNGAAMSGVSVIYSVTAGGGSIVSASETTGADGIARLTKWTLGVNPGTNTVTATAGSLPPVSFSATGVLVASSVQAATPTSQQAPAGSPVPVAPGVVVRDQNGNPMVGVAVAFSVTAGGGSVSPANVVTGADGLAQLTSWTLGSAAGINGVSAAVAGLPAVGFSATGTLVASSIAATTSTDQQAPAGSAVTEPPGVVVRDQGGTPMQGVSVTFAVTAGGGVVSPTTVVTDATGNAQLSAWVLGTSAATNTVTASVSGLPPVTFNATGTRVPTSMQATTPTSQTGLVGTMVTQPPRVVVRDQNNSPMPNVIVTFAVTAGGGSVTPATVTTGEDGGAQLTSWTLGPAAGANSVTASVPGISAVVFNATGLAPATIQAVTAITQEGPAGGAVTAPPGVIVRDQNGNPLQGVSVAFAVTGGGGSAAPASAITGADGIARLTSWTLGTTPGSNTVSATAGGLPAVTFTATGVLVAGSITATTATSQSAPVGTAVAQPPGVIVRDQFNAPMQGVTVNFAVTAGGGSVSPAAVVTGSNGVAQLTTWTLGPAAGTNTITATVTGLAAATFTATGLVPTTLEAASATSQQAPAGGLVTAPPRVRVRDQFGNVLPGVTVNFAVTAGGGAVSPGTAISGPDGIASLVAWTLGSTPGTNSVSASVPGLTPVAFSATGILVPSLVQAVTATSQEAPIGAPVAQPPGVSVRDQFGNLMSGVTVAFAVTSGGGSVNPASVATAGNGVAQLSSWTLGASAGTNTVSATVAGVAPVTFLAVGVLAPTSVQATTVTSQEAPTGAPVGTPPAVIVRAQNSAPLAGVPVTFTVTGGGGSVSPAVRMTGADGVAQLSSWTLGPATGSNTVTATVSGLAPVAFTATGTLGATTMLATTLTSQVGTPGAPVSAPPGVVIRDQNNQPVQGVTVTFTVTGGGGSRTPATVQTNSSGAATLTSWTLGSTPGTNTLTATAPGLPTLTFTATGVGPASVEAVTAISQSARVGTTVSAPPGVRVRDQNGNIVVGVPVTLSVTAGGGTVAPTSLTTGADGIARSTSWTLGPAAGVNSVTVTVAGLSPVTFNATGLAPATLTALTATSQAAPTGSGVTETPTVIVRDQNGNGLAGVSVTFAVTAGGGTIGVTSVTTGPGGPASAGSWILGTNPGTNTVVASVSGLPSVSFSATGVAPATAPTTIEALSPTAQEAAAGTLVAASPTVRVLNASSQPVSGVTVTFAVTAGGGSVGPAWVVTDGEGVAATTGWRLGTTPGANAMTATVSGLAPLTFSANGTGSGPVPSTLQIITTTSQSAPAGTAVSSPPGVLVRDQNGNLMQGVNVQFAVTSGGGTVAPSTVATNSSGAAFLSSWTLGSGGGANTVTATVSGLPSVSFSATGTLIPTTIVALTATSQQGNVGANPPELPRVRVRDQNGNNLSGANVTFAVTAGGGAVSPTIQTTAGDGTAGVTAWTLGFTPGVNTVTATISGLPSVIFTATGELSAATVAPITSTAQQAPAGSLVSDVPGVIVRDQLHNPLAGVAVTFAVTGGGGTVSPAGRTTGADGVARLSGWTLGTSAGTNTVTATVSGLPAVTFTATGTLVPSVVQAASPTTQQLSVGADVFVPPAVIVRDQNNAPMAGVTVVFAITAGGGSHTPTARTTGADGIAQLTRWTVGSSPGTNTITATPTGLPAVTFNAAAFNPASIQAASVTSQSAPVDAAVSQPPRVLVRDQNGNALYGVVVTFTVTAGGGSVIPVTATTGLDGIAQLVSWRTGIEPGTNTVAAAAPGLAPVVFTATGVVAPCPSPGAIPFATTINGTLGTSGCRLASGEFVEFYSFSVTQASVVRISQSSTAFDPYALLLRSDGKPVGENDDIALGTLDAELSAFILPGSYTIGATSYAVGELGPFTLRLDQIGSEVTDCKQYYTMRGTTTSQTLSTTDCLSETGNFRTDFFGVFLNAGETVTLTMNSGTVNPYLVFFDANGNLIEAGTSSGSSAQIVYTSPSARFYTFGATSARGGQTGAYTLSIQ
jgi:adhesin/invasin